MYIWFFFNPAYKDITISSERLGLLPKDGELDDIHTVIYKENTKHRNDQGPAPKQNENDLPNECFTYSPDENINIKYAVQIFFKDVLQDSTSV